MPVFTEVYLETHNLTSLKISLAKVMKLVKMSEDTFDELPSCLGSGSPYFSTNFQTRVPMLILSKLLEE